MACKLILTNAYDNYLINFSTNDLHFPMIKLSGFFPRFKAHFIFFSINYFQSIVAVKT